MRVMAAMLALVCLTACGDSPTAVVPASLPGEWGNTEGREGLTAEPPHVIGEPTMREQGLRIRVELGDDALPSPAGSQQRAR